ncbi:ATP-binding cassette domain-containing protein [Maribacter litopenaei]|uniref:ATP-binding cassette domain-containing protein n=1 Tax=Maribacter litopenaei TaxID=2976127 RepID=A0ABY5Y5G4_9FLAO|nr:ATP-binding cassette domain-containing protein [Maribacter litopenaei]UWX54277.1 ATP-binding cassette domain-containing protein [Maribacter litopenaei]
MYRENNHEKVLEVDGLKIPEFENSTGISFHLKKGEVLGVFGLMGAGRIELLETIFGLHPKDVSGEVKIDGKPLKLKSPLDSIKAGMALVTENRKRDGIIPGRGCQKKYWTDHRKFDVEKGSHS